MSGGLRGLPEITAKWGVPESDVHHPTPSTVGRNQPPRRSQPLPQGGTPRTDASRGHKQSRPVTRRSSPLGPRGTSQHRPLPVGVKAPKAADLQALPALQARRGAPKTTRTTAAREGASQLSARRRDAEPEPVKGGAAGAGPAAQGAGRGGPEGARVPQDPPRRGTCAWAGRRGGGQQLPRLRAPGVQWAPIVTALPSP